MNPGRLGKKCALCVSMVLLAFSVNGCGEPSDHDIYDIEQVSLIFNYGDQDGAELDVFNSDGTVKKYIVQPYSDGGIDLFEGGIPAEDQCNTEEYTISADDWNSIVNAVNENGFMKLPEELPEVEATDGSTRYIEVITSDGTHRSGGYCAGNGNGKEHQRFSEIVKALKNVTPVETVDDPEKRTAESLTKLSEGIYLADCYTDHKVNEYLAANIRDVDSFDMWMTQNLTHGVPTGEVPDTGCASFSVTDPSGDHLFGRNYDMPVDADSMIIRCYPGDGYASIGIVDMMHINLGRGCDNDIDDEGSRSLLFAAPWCISDGINEKGLGVSLLELQNEHVVNDTSKPDLLLYSAARVILDKCASVDEAVAILDRYDIYSPRSNSYHLFITDLSGESVILEWIDGELCVVKGNAVTNFLLLPEGSDPDQRRTKIERSLDSADSMTSEEAMAVLELVNRQTRWSAVYNLEKFSVDVCFNADYSNTINYSGE